MRKQKGTTLVELMLTVALMGVVAVAMYARTSAETEVVQAKKLGMDILEYSNAVQTYIVSNPSADYSTTRTGSAWLKSTACGGLSDYAYLHCDFPDFYARDDQRFGHISLTTDFTKSAVGGETYITSTTSTTPIHHQGVQRADLAGITAIVAAAGNAGIHSPAPMIINSSYGSNPLTAEVTIKSSNAPSQDSWLRVDGSNSMKASLAFDTSNPADQREIQGASVIRGYESESIILKTGATANSTIEIEPDKVTSKSGSTIFEITPTSASTTAGTASIDIGSGSVISKVGNTSSEVSSSRIIDKVGSNASAEITSNRISSKVGSVSLDINEYHTTGRGDHKVTSVVSVGNSGEVDFDAIIDGSEILNEVRLTIDGLTLLVGDLLIPGSSVDHHGHLFANGNIGIEDNVATARHLIGKINPPTEDFFWSINTAGDSIVNDLRIDGEFTVDAIGVRDGECTHNGQLGKTAIGDLLFCRASYWQQADLYE